MDYEVVHHARIREAYDNTGSARAAVIEGVGRTGRLVTSAALILMLTFLSMSSGPENRHQILATGLGAGILVDAVVVRALMVPAMGRCSAAGTGGCPSGSRGSCAFRLFR